MNKRPTAKRIRFLFDYNPDTGILTRRVTAGGQMRGDKVGCINDWGYIKVKVDQGTYQAHMLIWVWMTGKWPRKLVDHKDTDAANNKWNNLRLATRQQNSCNRKTKCDNVSGLKGVSKRKDGYVAVINTRGVYRYLGYFKDPNEAHAVYCAAAKKYFGEFARFA